MEIRFQNSFDAVIKSVYLVSERLALVSKSTKNKINLLVVCFFMFLIGTTYLFAQPIPISSVDDFHKIGRTLSHRANDDYILTADLGDPNDPSTWVEFGVGFFRGTFDGGGYTIYVNFNLSGRYAGLFIITKGATIKNLTVTGEI